jgi:DNA-binding MarR family transcriptional regulator
MLDYNKYSYYLQAMSDNLGQVLSDVSRLLRRAFDERARGIGVTRPQWQVLTMLARHEGINQGGLAELLDVEPITLCRMVDRLQEAGLVERRPDPNDRRAWLLFLADKAGGMLDELRPLGLNLFEEAMNGLDDAEREALLTMLKRVRTNLSRRPAPVLAAHG